MSRLKEDPAAGSKLLDIDEQRRKVCTEALIVRIMKAKRSLTQKELIVEVLTQLTLFELTPTV
jgi:hypothetical protein